MMNKESKARENRNLFVANPLKVATNNDPRLKKRAKAFQPSTKNVTVSEIHKSPKIYLPGLLLPFAPLLVVLFAGIFPCLLFSSARERFSDFVNILLGLTVEILPFLLISGLLTSVLATSARGRKWSQLLWRLASRNRAGAVATGIVMGFALPVCECGAAPVARQATREGASLPVGLVFLLAAPVINPVTLLTTWLAFGGDWLIVLGRIGLALLVAGGIGLLFSFHPEPQKLVSASINDSPEHGDHSHGEGEECEHEARFTFARFFDRTTTEFLETIKVAIPGVALAAAFQAYVPQQFFLEIGQGALLSAVALMLLAAMMSTCSSVDAFVALSFSGLFPAGSLLAFMVFGPIINFKSLLLSRLVLRWQTLALVALLVFQIVLLAAVVINLRIV